MCPTVIRVRVRVRVASVCSIAALGAALDAQSIHYNRDIRPILAQNCFRCHGPDERGRKAKMRLDVPGKARTAPIVERITAKDPEKIMPPPRSGKTLTPRQIALLTSWRQAGAKYERHWAFVEPARPFLPRVKDDGVTHPIDRFVRARLEGEGIRWAPPADRLTLARRVYLDLVGLPPTPAEADAFAQDGAPDAYEKLVDRLLASPRYGERWARRWLDLARYADSNGYEKDRARDIWPYRDWVIRACNADMPYDQFTIEQIAGDMLPHATPSQRIATGFHRNTMLNEEGGIDPLEFRFHAMTDRVATTGTVFLGLTMGCAQCHTHKFDPITHRAYYEFMAFLNNADEPEYSIPDEAKLSAYREHLAMASALLAELPSHWPKTAGSLEQKFSAWLAKHRAHTSRWTRLRPVRATTNSPPLTVEADGVVFASGDTTKHDIYRLRFAAGDQDVAAIRLEALPDDRLPARGPGLTYYEGTKGDFYLSEFRVRASGKPVKIASATHSFAANRFGNEPVSAQMALDGDLQTGWSVAGRSGHRHVAEFELATPIRAGQPFSIVMHFGRHFASSLGKFRISTTARLKGVAAQTLGAEVDRLLGLREGRLTAADRNRLRQEFLSTAVELARFNSRIRELRRRPRLDSTLVLKERAADNPRTTHRHHRGQYMQPEEPVMPGVPAFLHPFPAGAKRDRLGFARWLVAKDNPLAARVFVNRQWAAFFGRGIVATVGDFGAQGDLPTHPELLDWLAVEFMAQGWSRKKLHRLIVTSATYRQSSRVRADALARDPDDRLLSRSPRFRLEAEIIRDGALRAAGALVEKMFGKPVRPPQPSGVTEVAYGKPVWRTSRGEDRDRRSVYTFQKRTAPFAFYHTFDAPSGEECIARRDVSNSALQALTLLNDPMLNEIARALGARLAERAGKTGERSPEWIVRHGFRRVLTRHPNAREVAALLAFAARARRRFAADPEATEKSVEIATWTAVARALLSLDETITRN